MHLYFDQPIALTGFTTPAADIEREASRLVASRTWLWHSSIKFPDWRKQPGIGRRIRTRRPTDRTLVDLDDFVEILKPFDAVVWWRLMASLVKLAGQRWIKRVVDQRGFTGSWDTRYTSEKANRYFDINGLQVIPTGPINIQCFSGICFNTYFRYFDSQVTGQVATG